MKRLFSLILPALAGVLLALAGCSSDTAWDELPSAITQFVSQYYPGSGIKSYTGGDDAYRVTVSNAATITFNSDYQWRDINGNGSPLPQVLLYDQCPPALYEFLQSTSQTDECYAMKRDYRYYTLTMADTVLTYDIQTEKVTYPGEAGGAG